MKDNTRKIVFNSCSKDKDYFLTANIFMLFWRLNLMTYFSLSGNYNLKYQRVVRLLSPMKMKHNAIYSPKIVYSGEV